MTISQDDKRELHDALIKMSNSLDRFSQSGQNMPTNTATVRIDAGGVGIWIATTACIVMLFVSMIGAMWASNEFRRADDERREMREKTELHQVYINSLFNPESKSETK